jgi:F-type H+-transporting ATPase subunit gamma
VAKARELKRRIKSVQSTRQITRTMEMVSTSKLKRAQDRVVGARPYAQALSEVIGSLYSPDLAERFPLLRQPGPSGPRRVALVLITSNRGLCGAFNANLIREARHRMEQLERTGASVELHLVGKKGVNFFRFSKRAIASQRIDIGDRPTAAHASQLVDPMLARFAAGEIDGVEVVFAKFNSAVSTPPSTLPVLPVTPPKAKHETAANAENFILKPSAEAILERLLPLYVHNQLYRALVETAAAEHGARRTAMKNATDNAGDMLDILNRTMNRARQAQITQEIAEIVGGAEAQVG